MAAGCERLRIGLSASYLPPDPERDLFKNKPLAFVELSMIEWFTASGHLVYVIPLEREPERHPERVRAWIEDLDGLVLTGGADIAPESYGERPRDPAWRGDRLRDRYELALVSRALERSVPVFGICRGQQLLNVALGGTLWQDIATEVPGAIVHRDPALYDRLEHDVDLEPGSLLSKLSGGARRARVNSIHHQAVRQLGRGLVVEARSSADGVIEALRLAEHPGAPDAWAFAVQWHPEFQRPEDTHLLDRKPLMDAFLAACRRARRRTFEATTKGADR